jgi:hypothetical protein
LTGGAGQGLRTVGAGSSPPATAPIWPHRPIERTFVGAGRRPGPRGGRRLERLMSACSIWLHSWSRARYCFRVFCSRAWLANRRRTRWFAGRVHGVERLSSRAGTAGRWHRGRR